MSAILKIFKNIFEILYSKLIIIELIIRQKIFKQRFLFKLGGYGDLLIFIGFCEKYYKNIKFLNLGSIQQKILNIRVKKKNILNIFFKVPHWRVYYKIFFYVLNSRYVKKTKYDVRKLLSTPNTLKIKNIILEYINSENSANKLTYLDDLISKRYICFFVKQLVDNNFNWFNSFDQELHYSSEKEKVIKVLEFLIKQRINILILGEDRESGIDFLYQKIKNKRKYRNKIFFLKDFIKADDVSSKVALYNNSLGYIGNGSGHADYFYFLRKKTIIFDYMESIRPDSENERILNNLYLRKYLFKKIINKRNNKILPMKSLYKVSEDLIFSRNDIEKEIINKGYKKKYKIITNDIKEIEKAIKKIFKKTNVYF